MTQSWTVCVSEWLRTGFTCGELALVPAARILTALFVMFSLVLSSTQGGSDSESDRTGDDALPIAAPETGRRRSSGSDAG